MPFHAVPCVVSFQSSDLAEDRECTKSGIKSSTNSRNNLCPVRVFIHVFNAPVSPCVQIICSH